MENKHTIYLKVKKKENKTLNHTKQNISVDP